MWVVADSLVQLSELKRLVTSFRDLADDARWLSRDNGEARHHHVWRHDGAVENPNVILDDGKLTHHHPRANMYVAPNRGGLNNGAETDKNVVADSERHVSKCTVHGEGYSSQRQKVWQIYRSRESVCQSPFVVSAGRPQTGTSAEKAIPTDRDSCVVWGRPSG